MRRLRVSSVFLSEHMDGRQAHRAAPDDSKRDQARPQARDQTKRACDQPTHGTSVEGSRLKAAWRPPSVYASASPAAFGTGRVLDR